MFPSSHKVSGISSQPRSIRYVHHGKEVQFFVFKKLLVYSKQEKNVLVAL